MGGGICTIKSVTLETEGHKSTNKRQNSAELTRLEVIEISADASSSPVTTTNMLLKRPGDWTDKEACTDSS